MQAKPQLMLSSRRSTTSRFTVCRFIFSFPWFMLLAAPRLSLFPTRAAFAWISTSATPRHSMTLLATNSMTTTRTKRARIVSPTTLDECGERLRNGDLVAFPTETVYGLGCHALDETAIQKVFSAKERPLTDPLIVHVISTCDAQKLWAASSSNTMEGRALQLLADKFWPGPLTLVAKAASHVPNIVMANTGYVACRCPCHAVARQLIQAARVPIAAPSANKFGHVSPTKAQHVYHDLCNEDVWIVDDEDEICQVGVESTVAKLEWTGESGTITVLRQGAVSAMDILTGLQEYEDLKNVFTVSVKTQKENKEDVAEVSPGQCYRHYSPDIPSFMLSSEWKNGNVDDRDTTISTTVVIDFQKKLDSLEKGALAYRDLSAAGDSSEAAQAVFETLRWAEQVEGATRIVFPEIIDSKEADALTLALKDRLQRAASGVIIDSL